MKTIDLILFLLLLGFSGFFYSPLLFKHPVSMCESTCATPSSHAQVKLADSIHQCVNQPAVHHNDQSLKEQGDKDNALITPEAPN